MSTYRLHKNGVIYLYHWITPSKPFKQSTGLKIEPSRWNKEKMRPKSPSYKYKGVNVNQELLRMESAFQRAWNHFREKGGLTTIKLKQKFKEELSTEDFIPSTNGIPGFLQFFEKKMKEYKTADINNWQGYNTTLNHLKTYFGKEKPEFEDIDSAFYESFNDYLIQKKLSVNTRSNHWKHIKAIVKKAHMLKFHGNTDYQFFKRTRESSDTVYLNEQEVQNIFDLKLTGYLEKAKDYFLIGCYTGLRYSDWDKLNAGIIKDGQAIIRNAKTGERSVIPIAANVMRILMKYEDGKLPRKPSIQKLNEYIKDVANLAKIKEPIDIRVSKGRKRIIETKLKYELVTTHTARRSFATIMIMNGVPPHLIMKITAHKSLAAFERYVRFDELQASIQLKESESFQKSFGEALTWSEKLQTDPEFRKEKLKLLL